MTLHVSVALFRRDGRPTFKTPRKEASDNITQARKAAARFWRGNIRDPDKLQRIFVVSASGNAISVSECTERTGLTNRWTEQALSAAQANEQPHLAVCLTELGIDPDRAPPPMPDVLEINGVVYRREI